MARLQTSLIAAATALIAAPALAQEKAGAVDVPAMRVEQAIQILSQQSGVSIGFRDGRLAGVKSRAVRGRHTPEQALVRMLRNTGVRARRVAKDSYLIEAAPVPAPIKKAKPAAPIASPVPTPEPVRQEIVVTGTKRDIPLNVYPGGVQIISGDSLSIAAGGRGTSAIETRIASVASTHLGPGRNKLFVRGIADSSFVGPTQATVGQYWGNSRITYSAPDPSLRLYDISSVEVLEGPQGTLYGAGSLGGVVRVVPREPDLSGFSGSAWTGVQAVQHGDPGVDSGAIINVPLTDNLAFRAVGFAAKDGGYIDDTKRLLNDINKVETFGGRAALRYTPGNNWTLDLSAVGQQINGKDSQYAERGGDGISRSSSIAQPYSNDYWLADFVASKQWGDYELTTSVGYARQHVFEQFDGVAVTSSGNLIVADTPNMAERGELVMTDDGALILSPTAAAPNAGLSQTNRIRMLTAEARLSRRGPDGTGWLMGVSLLHNEAQVRREMDFLAIDTSLTGVKNQVREATFYGEWTLQPMDRLNITMGGRLTHSRLSGEPEDATDDFAFRVDEHANAVRTETRFLPSAAIAYRPTDSLTVFARYQQGFRPGGIAVRRDFIQRFKGDRVITAEAGIRYSSRHFDIALNTAHTRWDNIQADLIDGFGFPTTANVGDGRVLSLGAVARWRPLPGLEFDASLYYNKTKVTERYVLLPVKIESIDGAFISGGSLESETSLENFTRLPNIADVSGRVGFSHRTAVNQTLTLETNGFLRYVGKSTLGVGPILGQLQGNYLDTGLEMRLGNHQRGISLTLTNLLDSRGNRFALGSPFLVRDRNQITPLQPRTIRIGIDVAF